MGYYDNDGNYVGDPGPDATDTALNPTPDTRDINIQQSSPPPEIQPSLAELYGNTLPISRESAAQTETLRIAPPTQEEANARIEYVKDAASKYQNSVQYGPPAPGTKEFSEEIITSKTKMPLETFVNHYLIANNIQKPDITVSRGGEFIPGPKYNTADVSTYDKAVKDAIELYKDTYGTGTYVQSLASGVSGIVVSPAIETATKPGGGVSQITPLEAGISATQLALLGYSLRGSISKSFTGFNSQRGSVGVITLEPQTIPKTPSKPVPIGPEGPDTFPSPKKAPVGPEGPDTFPAPTKPISPPKVEPKPTEPWIEPAPVPKPAKPAEPSPFLPKPEPKPFDPADPSTWTGPDRPGKWNPSKPIIEPSPSEPVKIPEIQPIKPIITPTPVIKPEPVKIQEPIIEPEPNIISEPVIVPAPVINPAPITVPFVNPVHIDESEPELKTGFVLNPVSKQIHFPAPEPPPVIIKPPINKLPFIDKIKPIDPPFKNRPPPTENKPKIPIPLPNAKLKDTQSSRGGTRFGKKVQLEKQTQKIPKLNVYMPSNKIVFYGDTLTERTSKTVVKGSKMYAGSGVPNKSYRGHAIITRNRIGNI